MVVDLPQFMQPWAAAWGRGGQPLELLVLNVHPSALAADLPGGGRPARTFYIPVLDGCQPRQ
jgi:hypothetical protein